MTMTTQNDVFARGDAIRKARVVLITMGGALKDAAMKMARAMVSHDWGIRPILMAAAPAVRRHQTRKSACGSVARDRRAAAKRRNQVRSKGRAR